MNTDFLIQELEKNASIFNSIFIQYSANDEFISWKPSLEKWCLLEILCHLTDEEKEDFRTRVKFALDNSTEQPPSINPQGWVQLRNYKDQNYTDKCNEFFDERHRSLEWLKSLPDGDWNNYFIHQKFGKFTAHYLLTNWVAHDYLHIKQITRLRYDYLALITGENLKYAGEWNYKKVSD